MFLSFSVRPWTDQTGEGKVHVLDAADDQGEGVWVSRNGFAFGAKPDDFSELLTVNRRTSFFQRVSE